MRWGCAGLALLAAGAAQAEEAFPQPTASREARLDWVRRHTPVPARAAAAVDENSALFIASSSPLPAGRRSIVVREEALSPAFVQTTGGRSLRAELQVDCAERAVLLKRLDLYSRPNLQGEAVSQLGALPGWRKPQGMLTMGKALIAACGAERVAASARLPASPRPAAPAPSAAAPPAQQPLPAPGLLSPATHGGAYALQVAAVQSAEAAQAFLHTIQARHPELAVLSPATEPATVGGKRYVRALLAGAPDAPAAARLCEGLRAAGEPCFPRRWP